MSRKHPHLRFQYEPLDIEHFSEPASEQGAKMEGVTNPDVLRSWEAFHSMSLEEALKWTDLHQKDSSGSTYAIYTDNPADLEAYNPLEPEFIFNKRSLNSIRHLDSLLCKTNEALVGGGYFLCHAMTASLQREIILHSNPPVIGRIKCAHIYLWHRVFPKIPGLKKFYYAVTNGQKRSYHRVEILGRIARAGFRIVDEEFVHGEFFVLGQKIRRPLADDPPKCGPVIKLRRIGKGGETIGVYKFRTMYSYSEYLQDYMYLHGGLQKGGKFSDDCRVNFWGKWMRPLWLDELPMLLNWFRGQIKLVGVRPLSQQYFSLYSPEMQALRIKVKPGLIPPFYYEKTSPDTITEVQESEKAYIEEYLKHPFRTDWKYFWGSLRNIIFKHKRSN